MIVGPKGDLGWVMNRNGKIDPSLMNQGLMNGESFGLPYGLMERAFSFRPIEKTKTECGQEQRVNGTGTERDRYASGAWLPCKNNMAPPQFGRNSAAIGA